MEQRVNIEFCFKLGKTATETHEMLVKVYSVDAVSKKWVFQWFKRFRDGKEDVKDEPRSGRPPTSTTPDNIDRVRRMLADDRRLSLRMITEELTISLDQTWANYGPRANSGPPEGFIRPADRILICRSDGN
ncbi:Putative uncharacterized protein FLJ37770 [Araneus ventricosus]|uniref:Mos1 transposase HTH domain-containing protein n=1 Tax=Araneus ventricosus TaxID=182803 RepID=A0A4Y2JF62_ARAVE|nr:Putative uncharacterized protein FLJ37770 [Araneus ventricosus]